MLSPVCVPWGEDAGGDWELTVGVLSGWMVMLVVAVGVMVVMVVMGAVEEIFLHQTSDIAIVNCRH